MEFINKIETVNVDHLSDFERVDKNLRALLVSIVETLPGSRGFGLSVDVFDLSPYEARNAFAAELDEKVEEFIPEIRIADIEMEVEQGIMKLRIYVEGNEQEGVT